MMRRFLVFSAALVVLTGCSQPAYNHVGTGTAGLFFNIPFNWHQIDQSLVDKAQTGWNSSEGGKALLQSITWQTAWSPDAHAMPSVVFENRGSESGAVWAMTRTLYSQETDSINSNLQTALENIALPVSTASEGDGLQVLSNTKVTLDGLTGVEQELSWDVGGESQDLHSLALVNAAHTRLYFIMTRCAATCSTDLRNALSDVIDSVTVKEAKVG